MSKGQYFTTHPELQVSVFNLCKNEGRRLEPSAGRGDLTEYFANNGKDVSLSIELDESLEFISNDICIGDFFDLSKNEAFDTIFGNPPYVKFQEIDIDTKEKIDSNHNSLNLYLYFLEKSFYHLRENGEIVFIIPREFFSASRAKPIRELLWNNGTITDVIDFEERSLFESASPYVVIIRYQKDNFSHLTNYFVSGKIKERKEILKDGFIKFVKEDGKTLDNYFEVKVGIVSGANEVFEHPTLGNVDIICSDFVRTGQKRRFIFYHNGLIPSGVWNYLKQHKDRLLNRRIREFNENNWWEWGAVRNLHIMELDAYFLYVNQKTRQEKPFFIEKSSYFDGSVLALVPKKESIDLQYWRDFLNNAKELLQEQGFLVGSKFIFSQKSLSKLIV